MISEKNCQKYCYEPLELIENFYMAVSSSEPWDCHHRVETIMNCGQKELKAQGCFYHRPAHDLIFLPRSEHRRIHKLGNKTWLGRSHSKETKEKMRKSKAGENNPFFGKHHSEEAKEKNRRANLGNKVWLGKHHSEETKEKMRQALSGEKNPMYGRRGENSPIYGLHWWNDGKREILTVSSPGAGWKRGRLKI